MLNIEEGTSLVKSARAIVEKSYKNKGLEPKKTQNVKLNEKHGAFVTIKEFPSRMLRGCIGLITPACLYEAVQHAALSAAFKDTRFPSLQKKELGSVIFEISVMTEPTLVLGENLDELKKKIEIGRDGLIISNGYYSGLLLPQVQIEQKWNVDVFLENLCYKAGMTPDFLNDENTKIWKFQCQIFVECEPNGRIEEIKLR